MSANTFFATQIHFAPATTQIFSKFTRKDKQSTQKLTLFIKNLEFNPQQTAYHLALNPAQPEANSTQHKTHANPKENSTAQNSSNLKFKQPKNQTKPQKKISLKPISHHQATAIVVKPRVIVAQKALSIELKAFVGKQLCAQSRTHHAFIALIFVF